MAFEGVLYVLKTGIPWRCLPKEFGAWQTVYELFARWAKSGALEKLLETFKESADNEWLSIDSSIKVHKHSSAPQGGQKKQSITKQRGNNRQNPCGD